MCKQCILKKRAYLWHTSILADYFHTHILPFSSLIYICITMAILLYILIYSSLCNNRWASGSITKIPVTPILIKWKYLSSKKNNFTLYFPNFWTIISLSRCDGAYRYLYVPSFFIHMHINFSISKFKQLYKGGYSLWHQWTMQII